MKQVERFLEGYLHPINSEAAIPRNALKALENQLFRTRLVTSYGLSRFNRAHARAPKNRPAHYSSVPGCTDFSMSLVHPARGLVRSGPLRHRRALSAAQGVSTGSCPPDTAVPCRVHKASRLPDGGLRSCSKGRPSAAKPCLILYAHGHRVDPLRTVADQLVHDGTPVAKFWTSV